MLLPSVCEEVRVRLWIVLIGRGVIDCVLCDEPHVLCRHLPNFIPAIMVRSCFDFITMLMVQLCFILETRGTLKYSKRTMDQDNFLLDKKIEY